MKTTRSNVFETNSSSVHTVCVRPITENYDTNQALPVDYDGNVIGEFMEFGWSGKCNTASDKLAYLLVMIWETIPYDNKPNDASIWCTDFKSERDNAIRIIKETDAFKRLENILKEYGGYNGLDISNESEGYIDHQSCEYYRSLDGFLNDNGIFSDKDVYDFIVGPSYIVIDNDNH